MKRLAVTMICFLFALSLISCNSSKDGDYPPTIMVNGTLYYSTDNTISVNLEENNIQYTMSYAENGVPKKNGETNFDRDTGSPYIVFDDRVAVSIDNEWIEFKKNKKLTSHFTI